MFCGKGHYQDGRWVAVLSTAVNAEFRTFPQRHEDVPGKFCPGGYPRRQGSRPRIRRVLREWNPMRPGSHVDPSKFIPSVAEAGYRVVVPDDGEARIRSNDLVLHKSSTDTHRKTALASSNPIVGAAKAEHAGWTSCLQRRDCIDHFLRFEVTRFGVAFPRAAR